MTREEFDQYVDQIEQQAKSDPAKVRRKTRLLLGFGYAVLAGIFLLSLGLTIWSIWWVWRDPAGYNFKTAALLVIGGSIFLHSLVKSLWMRFEPPSGLEVSRDDVPALFELLDDLSVRSKNGSLKFDRVLLTTRMNASVCETPKFGLLGVYQRDLILGLPLLQTMGAEDFRAILAHEFAHLKGGHGQFGRSIYRSRTTWGRLAGSLEDGGGIGGVAVRTFLDWFWPRFNGHAFALRRGEEYEADAFAASYESADAMATALVRSEVVARQVEAVWSKLYDRSASESTPPAEVFSWVEDQVRNESDPTDSRKWLGEALLMATDSSDTHPGLTDRLGALGRPVPAGSLDAVRQSDCQQLPVIGSVDPSQCAAAAILPEALVKSAMRQFSSEWRESVSDYWTHLHEDHIATTKQFGEYAKQDACATPEKPLSEEEQLERLNRSLQQMLHERDQIEAEAIVDRMLALRPKDFDALILKGRLALDRDDESGLEYLEEAIREQPLSTMESLGVQYEYHQRRGETDALAVIKRRADAHDAFMSEYENDRYTLTKKDQVRPHQLTGRELDRIRAVLRRAPQVKRVVVAEKVVEFFPEIPQVTFCLEFKSFRIMSERRVQQILQELIEGFVLEREATACILYKGDSPEAWKKCAKVKGSTIYKSSEHADEPEVALPA